MTGLGCKHIMTHLLAWDAVSLGGCGSCSCGGGCSHSSGHARGLHPRGLHARGRAHGRCTCCTSSTARQAEDNLACNQHQMSVSCAQQTRYVMWFKAVLQGVCCTVPRGKNTNANRFNQARLGEVEVLPCSVPFLFMSTTLWGPLVKLNVPLPIKPSAGHYSYALVRRVRTALTLSDTSARNVGHY